MKVTNGEIFDAQAALSELASQKMPVQTSMKVLKLRELIKPIVSVIEAMRNKLIKEYGVPSERGSSVTQFIQVPDTQNKGEFLRVPNPKYDLFVKDFEEARAEEVELEFEPIHLRSSIELSPKALLALEKFVTV